MEVEPKLCRALNVCSSRFCFFSWKGGSIMGFWGCLYYFQEHWFGKRETQTVATVLFKLWNDDFWSLQSLITGGQGNKLAEACWPTHPGTQALHLTVFPLQFYCVLLRYNVPLLNAHGTRCLCWKQAVLFSTWSSPYNTFMSWQECYCLPALLKM